MWVRTGLAFDPAFEWSRRALCARSLIRVTHLSIITLLLFKRCDCEQKLCHGNRQRLPPLCQARAHAASPKRLVSSSIGISVGIKSLHFLSPRSKRKILGAAARRP